MKKILNYLLLFVVFFTFLANPIFAYAKVDLSDRDNVAKLLSYCAGVIGCGFKGDWYGASSSFNECLDWIEEEESKGNSPIIENSNGTVQFSDALMDKLKSYIDSQIDSQSGGDSSIGDYGDYYVLPTSSYADFWSAFYDHGPYINDSTKWPSEMLSAFRSIINSHDAFTIYANGWYEYWTVYSFDPDVAFFYSSGPTNIHTDPFYVYSVSFTGVNGDAYKNIHGQTFKYKSNELLGLSMNASTPDNIRVGKSDFKILDCWLYTRNGEHVKVWKSLAKLKSYLGSLSTGGNKNYYLTSNYYDYDAADDNSITISSQTVQNIINNNYNVYDDTIQVIINNIVNQGGSCLTERQVQLIIDAAIEKLLKELQKEDEKPTEPETPTDTETSTEVPTETETVTETPTETESGDISGNDDISGNGADGPKTLSWLEKIYNKLVDIKRAIIGDTIVGGLGDLLTAGLGKLSDAFDSLKDAATGLIPEVGDLAKDIVNGGIEKVGEIVGSVGTSMAPVAEILPEKFPTCIPWDLVAIVTVFSATPDAPIFEVPVHIESIGIDETLVLDLSNFEPVSKVSRTMLTLLFVVMLMQLTIKLTRGGGVDE